MHDWMNREQGEGDSGWRGFPEVHFNEVDDQSRRCAKINPDLAGI
jgi:hypothetical protein